MDTRKQFEDLIRSAVEETGVQLRQSKEEVADYMAQRAMHLSRIVAEPGFDEAVIAERNNVAMRAGLAASANANAIDQRIVGIIGGALRIAAVALV